MVQSSNISLNWNEKETSRKRILKRSTDLQLNLNSKFRNTITRTSRVGGKKKKKIRKSTAISFTRCSRSRVVFFFFDFVLASRVLRTCRWEGLCARPSLRRTSYGAEKKMQSSSSWALRSGAERRPKQWTLHFLNNNNSFFFLFPALRNRRMNH